MSHFFLLFYQFDFQEFFSSGLLPDTKVVVRKGIEGETEEAMGGGVRESSAEDERKHLKKRCTEVEIQGHAIILASQSSWFK